jgi:hypothetical protein
LGPFIIEVVESQERSIEAILGDDGTDTIAVIRTRPEVDGNSKEKPGEYDSSHVINI